MGEVGSVSKIDIALGAFLAGLLIGSVVEGIGTNNERREWVAGHRRIVDGKVEFWHGPEWRKQP